MQWTRLIAISLNRHLHSKLCNQALVLNPKLENLYSHALQVQGFVRLSYNVFTIQQETLVSLRAERGKSKARLEKHISSQENHILSLEMSVSEKNKEISELKLRHRKELTEEKSRTLHA